jgi:hypothetical protein
MEMSGVSLEIPVDGHLSNNKGCLDEHNALFAPKTSGHVSLFIVLLNGICPLSADAVAALYPNIEIYRFYKPEVLRFPFSLCIDEFEIKVPHQTRNQLGHFENGDMFSQTCP